MSRSKGINNKTLHIWTEEEKEYLKQITPGHYHKEIQKMMNEKFNLELTLGQIKGAVKRYKLNTGITGHFKKGHTPFNKGTKGLTRANRTSFKKGNKPKNYKPVGSERLTKDGYIQVKVQDPNKWKLKHIVIWEKENGPIPKGHAVIFGDGNSQNLDINNLVLVSRQQLLVLNRNKLIKNDVNLTKTGIMVADIYLKINERRKQAK